MSNTNLNSCRVTSGHMKTKTISPSKLLYHFTARGSLSDKHLYLHNNVRDFTNATLSSYSSYQSQSRGCSYYGHIYTLKPKETLRFLDLSNKSISNIISNLQKIKQPKKYVQNQLNILHNVGSGRASVYNRMPNRNNFQDVRQFHIGNRISVHSQTFKNLSNLYKKLPRRIIQNYILSIMQENNYDGIYEGTESYNSYLLFSTSKLEIQSRRQVSG